MAGFVPQPRRDADRNVGVFRKHGQLAESRLRGLYLARLVKKLQAHRDGSGDRGIPFALLAGIEGHKALFIEPLVDAGDRLSERLPALNPVRSEEHTSEIQSP